MLVFPLISASVAAIAIAIMLRMKQALPMDHPNERSLHGTPIPRSGGIGILLGLSLGWALFWPDGLMPLLGMALILGGLSLWDDLRGLSVKLRFAVQIAIAALAVVSFEPDLPGGIIGAAAALFALVWMTNLYNFMDGANGLAGGMAFFGFGFYALAAWQGGGVDLAVVAFCVAAAAAGFLWFNFDPARIFMGDGGSIPLGFLAAALGLAGWRQGVWPLAFPLLAFSPFIADASLTLAKRLLRGEKIWQAHREHYYQRLVLMGWGHRRLALTEYGLMLACGVSALLTQEAGLGWQAGIASVWLALYAWLAVTIDQAWNQHLSEAQ